MKPTAYLYAVPDAPLDANHPAFLYFKNPACACDAILKTDVKPLYTAHEIAEFVVTLSHDIVGKPATTEQLVIEETYLDIADKIEQESQKVL